MKPQTQNRTSVNPREDQEKLAMKAVMLPLTLGAVMTTPSYVLQLQRTGTPVMAAGLYNIIGKSLQLWPTVTSKQASRSAAGFATPKKGEEDKHASTLTPAIAAVSLEAGLSGFNGMMAGLSKGNLVKPTDVSRLRNIAWNLEVLAKHTPHTFGYTAFASAANIVAMAFMKPLTTQWSQSLTDNFYMQTAAGITAAAIAAGVLTTPINTAGGRFLKSLSIEQQGLGISVNATKTFAQTTGEIFKAGRAEGIKALYKPLPLTVGMTWLAFAAFEGVNHAVDATYDCKQAVCEQGLFSKPTVAGIDTKPTLEDKAFAEDQMQIALTA